MKTATRLATMWMSHGRIELCADGARQTVDRVVSCTRDRDREGRAFPPLEVDVLEHLPRLLHGSLRREILAHWWASLGTRLEGITDLVIVVTPGVSPLLPCDLRRVAAASRCRLLFVHHDFCLVAAAVKRSPALLVEPRIAVRAGGQARWTEVRCERGEPTCIRISAVTREAPARLPVIELDEPAIEEGLDVLVESIHGQLSLPGGLRFSLDSTAVLRAQGAPRPVACFTHSECTGGRLLAITGAPGVLEVHTGLGPHAADHAFAGILRLPPSVTPPTLVVCADGQQWQVGLPDVDEVSQGPYDVLSLVA